jgi:hypothetical protein
MNTTGSRSTRQLHSFITHLGFAIAFAAGAAQGGAESDWTRPFTPDEHTAEVCFQVLKAALASLAGKR